MKGINVLKLEAATGRWMRTRIQSVKVVQAVNTFYVEKNETVASHCGLATLQEKFVEPDDEVTGQ